MSLKVLPAPVKKSPQEAPQRPPTWEELQQWTLDDGRKSAIPDDLWKLNVSVTCGDDAIRLLTEEAISQVQRVTEYATEPAKRILSRYEFATAGGWVAYGQQLNGEMGHTAYFKPIAPRIDAPKGFGDDGKPSKRIKYETPQKCVASPILPWVTPEIAEQIFRRFDVESLPGEAFWQTVQRCTLPVCITEGLKKALSLLARGIPAIAIRGITQWHKKQSSDIAPIELHDELAHFVTPGRKIYICFDQDNKPKTRKAVTQQIRKLGDHLTKLECLVHVLDWDQSLGKGIDDVFYGLGDDAQTWFDELLGQTLTLKCFKREAVKRAAAELISQIDKLSFPIERFTEGEYLPDLPKLEQGTIHVLNCPQNSGKTTRIGKDWVQKATAEGWNVLVFSPTNALGKQTASNWGIPHFHTFGFTWKDAIDAHGVVMCVNSLHRIPIDFLEGRPTLLILDEANQVIEGMLEGGTLQGERWREINGLFAKVVRRSVTDGAIVLSEDRIPDRCVESIQRISMCDRIRVFEHKKISQPWDCTVYGNQLNGFRQKFLAYIQDGNKAVYVTTSQREAKRMERAIRKYFPQLKVFRIDSETNQQGAFDAFFDSPDSWIDASQPDVLILSPSARSGVSIQGGISPNNAWFNSVWGYFPALDTRTQHQMLGRYRPAVPRFVCAPTCIIGDGLQSPTKIKRRFNSILHGMPKVFGLEDACETSEVEEAIFDYLSKSQAVEGAQALIAQDALITSLKQSGHNVTLGSLPSSKRTGEFFKAIQKELWREEAILWASLQVEGKHTKTWAHETMSSDTATYEDRLLAKKVLLREEFPGVHFDDAGECYEAICEDWGAMIRGVRLQARIENLEAALKMDRDAAEQSLTGSIRSPHRVPKGYVKALLMSKIGILSLLDGTPWGNDDQRAIDIKSKALYWAKELERWFRLQIKETQTPAEICNKLLKKLGFDKEHGLKERRVGGHGDRTRIYWVEVNYSNTRTRLLEALNRKLSGLVDAICNIEKPPKTNHVHTPEQSRRGGENLPLQWSDPAVLADIKDMIKAATTPAALAAIRAMFPPEALERAMAS